MSVAYRIYIKKKDSFQIEAQGLKKEFELLTKNLQQIQLYMVYDIWGIDQHTLKLAKKKVFSDIVVDEIYDRETIEASLQNKPYLSIEYLPGQYDQRADSAIQCILLLSGSKVSVKTGKLIVFETVSDDELDKIKTYYINQVEMREKDLSLLQEDCMVSGEECVTFDHFNDLTPDELQRFAEQNNLSLNNNDLLFIQEYFKKQELRNPTATEIRVIDTYWSDHCRHTTFLTHLTSVTFLDGPLSSEMKNTYRSYLESRQFVHESQKDMCLMDMATIVMKEMRKKGLLESLDESEEINACTVKVKVDVNGEKQDWLLLFKNETHNHPTEIEPFGGAATCIGGAIRDPLSGRAYVYQGVRISGSCNPWEVVDETIPGKLPQKVISKEAANGFSSYGNQIGLATSLVKELYHPGFKAKHMELGAVVGAVPLENVRRESPVPGDLILLIGGKTGRDGIGGASGSSKEHHVDSIHMAGAEVQKGNAPEERKLQRLFQNPNFSKLIKKCNDFGAGGVAVAIGELARGIYVDLTQVPLKYDGLNCTEIAISESQERMAVVISNHDKQTCIQLVELENLEATVVGNVTADDRLTMVWKEKKVVDIARTFLDTNGVKAQMDVVIDPCNSSVSWKRTVNQNSLKDKLLSNLQHMAVCSQQPMVEMFDSTIGSGTVLMPYGGKYQKTENEGSVHLFPVMEGTTQTASAMTYGYDPSLGEQSPYLMAMYSIVEALTRLVSMGVEYRGYLSMQEYFKRLKTTRDWGQAFSAMLGLYEAQKQFGIAAIGGKDSMSGSFESIHVPPTVVAFAVNTVSTDRVITSEFKKHGSYVYVLQHTPKDTMVPDFSQLKANYEFLLDLNHKNKILAAMSVKTGGLAETICKMSFGNHIGFVLENMNVEKCLFDVSWGSIVIETSERLQTPSGLSCVNLQYLGTTGTEMLSIGDTKLSILEAITAWEAPFQALYSKDLQKNTLMPESIRFSEPRYQVNVLQCSKPRVAIPVFPGTNCEFDTKFAFEKEGASGVILPFKNRTTQWIKESISALSSLVNQSEILVLSGGFSAGDEPDGSGKFISIVLQNDEVRESVENLLQRGGLVLGICNGFQALIKSGLLPYGQLGEVNETSPTLTTNQSRRHISKMVLTKVVSNLSPWYWDIPLDSVHCIPVSHGEGRFIASQTVLEQLAKNGQIATRYVDFHGNPSMEMQHNPNGSLWSVEGITSRDGRILGKMGHSERYRANIYKNIPNTTEEAIFRSGVKYFL